MLDLNNLFSLLQTKGESKRLSDYTGISTGNISDWKSGRSKPSAETLVKIADYFKCSVDYLLGRTNIKELNLPIPNRIIKMPVYIQNVSAGKGNLILDGDYQILEFYEDMIPHKATYGVYISGDSMEPLIHNEQLVWVEDTQDIASGEIGIFQLNDEYFCKKFYQPILNGSIELISLNKNYVPIDVTGSDDFKCRGRVLIR